MGNVDGEHRVGKLEDLETRGVAVKKVWAVGEKAQACLSQFRSTFKLLHIKWSEFN